MPTKSTFIGLGLGVLMFIAYGWWMPDVGNQTDRVREERMSVKAETIEALQEMGSACAVRGGGQYVFGYLMMDLSIVVYRRVLLGL